MIWLNKLCPHLKASQGDFKRNIQRRVDDSGYRFNEGHEEQREPDDADQQHHNHASHPVLYHLLLLLASRLRIPLQEDEIKGSEMYYLTCMQGKTLQRSLFIGSPHETLFHLYSWCSGNSYMFSMPVAIKVKMEQNLSGQEVLADWWRKNCRSALFTVAGHRIKMVIEHFWEYKALQIQTCYRTCRSLQRVRVQPSPSQSRPDFNLIFTKDLLQQLTKVNFSVNSNMTGFGSETDSSHTRLMPQW